MALPRDAAPGGSGADTLSGPVGARSSSPHPPVVSAFWHSFSYSDTEGRKQTMRGLPAPVVRRSVDRIRRDLLKQAKLPPGGRQIIGEQYCCSGEGGNGGLGFGAPRVQVREDNGALPAAPEGLLFSGETSSATEEAVVVEGEGDGNIVSPTGVDSTAGADFVSQTRGKKDRRATEEGTTEASNGSAAGVMAAPFCTVTSAHEREAADRAAGASVTSAAVVTESLSSPGIAPCSPSRESGCDASPSPKSAERPTHAAVDTRRPHDQAPDGGNTSIGDESATGVATIGRGQQKGNGVEDGTHNASGATELASSSLAPPDNDQDPEMELELEVAKTHTPAPEAEQEKPRSVGAKSTTRAGDDGGLVPCTRAGIGLDAADRYLGAAPSLPLQLVTVELSKARAGLGLSDEWSRKVEEKCGERQKQVYFGFYFWMLYIVRSFFLCMSGNCCVRAGGRGSVGGGSYDIRETPQLKISKSVACFHDAKSSPQSPPGAHTLAFVLGV